MKQIVQNLKSGDVVNREGAKGAKREFVSGLEKLNREGAPVPSSGATGQARGRSKETFWFAG